MPEASLPSARRVASERNPAIAARRRMLLGLLTLLCLLPLFVNNYVQFVVNTMLVYCLVAVGFNVVLGYLGQLAFANAAFFGVGAYATGLSMVHWGLSAPAGIALGGIAGAAFGFVVGLPALRVKGYYLAIATLAVGELMRWLYVHSDRITFGPGGFSLPDIALFGKPLNEAGKYYLFLAVVALAIAATSLLLRSRFGRAFVAIRNNERAAASLGIDGRRMKILAFVWSGMIVGLGGALFALLNGRVSPDTFGLSQLLMHFAIVMVGGLGNLAGSVVGAVLLTGAPEVFRNFPGLEEIVFSTMLIFVIFLMPRGVGGLLADVFPLLRERLYREP